jgi:hypothetical protein
LEAPPSPQIARKGVDWVKEGSKWCCKVEECKESYATKWVLIVHLRRVHEFIVEKGNLGHLSICNRGPDIKMNW